MSINASLSSDGLEEVNTPPTLKEMCIYKCVTNKEILTEEVKVDEATNVSRKLDWEKYRLKEPIPKEIVEALLDAGEKYLFMLTPEYEPVLAAIRMSQPEHLVKVHVSNTDTLRNYQLELLLSGGNVKSLDIHGCTALRHRSLDVINKFGSKFYSLEDEPKSVLSGVVDITMNLNLDGELFSGAVAVVPRLMRMAEIAMTNSVVNHVGWKDFVRFLIKVSRILWMAVSRFPGEINELCGPSVLVIMKELMQMMVYQERYRNDLNLRNIFSSMMKSFRKLCLNSGPRRTAFRSEEDAKIVKDFLTKFVERSLYLTDTGIFALIGLLTSILQDAKVYLGMYESMIVFHLGELLCSVHSDWERSKSSNSDSETNDYSKLKRIASLLNYVYFLESNPRFGYEASDTEKEILMKFK